MPFLASIEGQFAFGRQPATTQPTPTPTIITQDLLLYLDSGNPTSYPGSGTTWTDLSSNVNNATSLTGVTYSSSNSGILIFDGSTGSGSLVSSKYNTTYTGKTVFVAGNLVGITTGTYRAMIGSSTGSRNFNFYFFCTSSNTYQLHFSAGGTGTLSVDMNYTPGNWFTAAVTQGTDGTTIYYLNGAQVNQTTQTFFQYVSPSTEFVGRADNFWNGPLPVITVYKTALSASQILQNHNAVYNRYPPNSGASVLAFARNLSTTFSGQTIAPTSGGALTINSAAVGNFEFAVADTTTISAFSAASWFSSTKDTVSSWIIINGNLTIDAGQTFIPSVRKLFTVIYVTGNLVCNGSISMTARGANHSGTGDSGGATTAVAIRIGTGTFGVVSNPEIPAAGGAGGSGRSTAGINSGTAGTAGGTGGGGGGYWFNSGPTSGSGSAGTCFSGGAGGGSSYNNGPPTVTSGGTNGGAGGNAGGISGGGGAGNNGGVGIPTLYNGTSGTGGTLIVICAGTLSGNGSFVSDGSLAGNAGGVRGGDSGGGSITVLYGTDSSTTTTSASGRNSGGAGTARKLAIGAN